jgi:hypothetical protein
LVGIRAGVFHPVDGGHPANWAGTFGLLLGWN